MKLATYGVAFLTDGPEKVHFGVVAGLAFLHFKTHLEGERFRDIT